MSRPEEPNKHGLDFFSPTKSLLIKKGFFGSSSSLAPHVSPSNLLTLSSMLTRPAFIYQSLSRRRREFNRNFSVSRSLFQQQILSSSSSVQSPFLSFIPFRSFSNLPYCSLLDSVSRPFLRRVSSFHDISRFFLRRSSLFSQSYLRYYLSAPHCCSFVIR